MRSSRSNSTTIIIALSATLAGILMLIIGDDVETEWLSTLLLNVGAFVLASVVLALFFERWQLRSLLDDLYDEAQITDQLRRSGITGFSATYYDSVPWGRLFQESSKVNVVFAYSSTWRNSHRLQLKDFLLRQDSHLEVVLPNPENEIVVRGLALRFGHMEPEDLQARIIEARDFFVGLAESGQGSLSIYYADQSPTYSLYRFSKTAVMASYRHAQGRGPFVTLTAERGGELYAWLRSEWYGLTEDGLAAGLTKQVYPPQEEILAEDHAEQPGS